MKMESRQRALDKMYRRRDRYEIPEWQREADVWDAERQQKLIDSILRGWDLPKFYFLRVEGAEDSYEVVDGQQRLVAIWAFFDGKLQLSDESARQFGGPNCAKTYPTLPDSVVDALDDFEIQYDEISDAAEDELAELFQRLQLGVALTPDERLNAVMGSLRDFCKRLAAHPFFQKVSFPGRRYAYFGVCARFAFLEIQRIPNTLRFQELQGLLQQYSGFSHKSPAAMRMIRTLDFLDRAFPVKSAALRSRVSLLTLLRITARLVEAGVKPENALTLGAFFESFISALRTEVEKGSEAEDEDLIEFQECITQNLTSGRTIRARERIMYKKLLLFDPTLVESLSSELDGQPWVADINTLGEAATYLVTALNSAFAGVTGVDLFKPTNETARAFAALRTPIECLSDYGHFVDSLYVLVYESTADGTRYSGELPDFVKDIRDLRTQLRHDVDHGSRSKAASKRRHLGTAFQKYSGLASPDVAPNSAFPIVQVKMLTELKEMLNGLLSKYQDSSA